MYWSSAGASFPPEYRMPKQTPTLAEAQAYCRELAESHYENFHVATWFLPKRLRPHFQSIYAYCRISDDLGDEVGDAQQSLALLDFWDRRTGCLLSRRGAASGICCSCGNDSRLQHSRRTPFADLLVAFRQDQTVTRYQTMADVLGLLPLFGQSGWTFGAVCLRLSRSRSVYSFRISPVRRCSWRISGRMYVRITPGSHLSSAGRYAAIWSQDEADLAIGRFTSAVSRPDAI